MSEASRSRRDKDPERDQQEGAEVDDSALERVSGGVRGTYWLPEVDDEVVVSFAHGKRRRPVILGQLWNGKDKPEE